MKKLFFVLAFVFAALVSDAQTAPLKIGYVDVEYIISQMPELKKVETELQTLQTQLKKQYDGKVAEYQKKVQEYQQYGANVPDAVRQNTERELQQLGQNIQKLEQDSQNDLQKKQMTLMDPIYTKVGDAIEALAKEQGFSMLLSKEFQGLTIVVYGDEKLDMSDTVLKKMGITPTAPTTDKK
jgi:outer membrane protein